jgi:cephalosporin hydroxylase
MAIPFDRLPVTAFELSLVATQYRASTLHSSFVQLNADISMLHPDALALLYHLAAFSLGPVLELGPYTGGSTIALARGLAASGRGLKTTSIEIGGRYDHPNYPTSDIVASLRANVLKHGLQSHVNVVVGDARDPAVVREVKRLSEGMRFALLVIDSDGQVERDVNLYCPFLSSRAYLVVDDYYSPGAPEKEAPTRSQLDNLAKRGVVESFGVHGWGTWFGRFI